MWFEFCDEYTEYNITDEELDDRPNDSLIHFIVYIYQWRCETHGIIPNGPSVCRISEENDDIKNFLIKRPKYGKNKHLKDISCSIGELHKVYYQLMLKNYAYHRMLLCLLGKHEWQNIRREEFLAENNSVMIEHDYTE